MAAWAGRDRVGAVADRRGRVGATPRGPGAGRRDVVDAIGRGPEAGRPDEVGATRPGRAGHPDGVGATDHGPAAGRCEARLDAGQAGRPGVGHPVQGRRTAGVPRPDDRPRAVAARAMHRREPEGGHVRGRRGRSVQQVHLVRRGSRDRPVRPCPAAGSWACPRDVCRACPLCRSGRPGRRGRRGRGRAGQP